MFLPERLSTEYRSYCYHDPGQWSFYPAAGPVLSTPRFSFPGEAALHQHEHQGPVPGPAGCTDRFPYGASDTRCHSRAFFPGRCSFSPQDSQLLFPAGRSRRVLPPVFDQFFEELEDAKVCESSKSTVAGARTVHETEPSVTEWTSSRESGESRAGSASPSAGKEDEEDSPSSNTGSCLI